MMTNEHGVLELLNSGNFPRIRDMVSLRETLRFAQAIRDHEAAKRIQLEAQIGMLAEQLESARQYIEHEKHVVSIGDIVKALSATQPTADAFVARIKVDGKIEELKEVIGAVCQLANESTYHMATCVYREVEERLRARLEDLRKGKE